MAVAGDPIVVGAIGDDDNGSRSGSAYVYTPSDSDGDGVDDDDDLCAATVLPDEPTRGLKKNRYIATADGFVSTDGVVASTLADTAGCWAAQIIDAQGLGDGHTKFGLSRGARQVWIASVSP